jgi:hypothetical protein
MNRHKPGEYVSIAWDVEPRFEVVYGHVDEEVFAASLSRQDTYREVFGPTEHLWARWLFAEGWSDFDRTIQLYGEKSRGTFPVTVAFWKTNPNEWRRFVMCAPSCRRLESCARPWK